nr:TetR/AcrR family transcriptional regulator [Clostridium perfringens]
MNRTKKAIFEAAINVFATSGYNGSTVDEIASKANVAKGTLYYNFKSKEEIFNFVISKGLEIWHEKLTDIENLEDEPIEKLKNFLKCNLNYYMKIEHFLKW